MAFLSAESHLMRFNLVKLFVTSVISIKEITQMFPDRSLWIDITSKDLSVNI